MIVHTNNNRELYLAGVDEWLARPDVREMHFADRELEVEIVSTTETLADGLVLIIVGGGPAVETAIGQLRSTIANWFAAPAPIEPPLERGHDDRGGARGRTPADEQLLLL